MRISRINGYNLCNIYLGINLPLDGEQDNNHSNINNEQQSTTNTE
jgi:hypothetical protein